MTNPIKKLLILATVALTSATCAQTWAQTQDSPYSMLGYGVLNDHVSASQRQMGGVAATTPRKAPHIRASVVSDPNIDTGVST